MTLQAGLLRKRITIQESVESQTGKGEVTDSWEQYAVRWASVEPVRGTERFLDSERYAEVDVVFRLRYLKGITPKMRIRYDSRTFDIQSIVNVEERNRELEILTTETV